MCKNLKGPIKFGRVWVHKSTLFTERAENLQEVLQFVMFFVLSACLQRDSPYIYTGLRDQGHRDLSSDVYQGHRELSGDIDQGHRQLYGVNDQETESYPLISTRDTGSYPWYLSGTHEAIL